MGRIGIRSFSSRGRNARQMLVEDYGEDLFEATTPINQDLKNEQQQQQQQHQDTWHVESWPETATNHNENQEEEDDPNLNIVSSTSSGGDVFDGLSLNPSSSSAVLGAGGADEPDSECQAREDFDVGDDDNVVIDDDNKKVSDNNEGDHNDNDNKMRTTRDPYADLREEIRSDDDTASTTSGYSSADTSTLSSLNPKPVQTSEAFCHDDLQIASLFFQFGEKGAESIDEVNRFLYSELEVGGFVEEVEEFRQVLVRDGMQKLSEIEWSEVMKFSPFDGSASAGQEKPTLPASDTSASATEPSTITGPQEDSRALAVVPVDETSAVFAAAAAATDPTTENSDPLAGCLSGLTLEEKQEEKHEDGEGFEGFEMPFPSWEESVSKEEEGTDEKRVNKKRSSFLSKLSFPNPTKRGRVASALSKKPNIMRVQLRDGSMASVSVETVERLQACHWV